jgi:hypothetical protein
VLYQGVQEGPGRLQRSAVVRSGRLAHDVG